MWRITDDFWDKVELLYDMFSRAENGAPMQVQGTGRMPICFRSTDTAGI